MSDNLCLLAVDCRQALFDAIKVDDGASNATRFEVGRAVGLLGRMSDAHAALLEALEKSREQFLFYEQSHLAKYPPWDLEHLRKGVVNVPSGRDAYEKALVNAEFAAMCVAAITLARTGAAS